MLVRVQVPPSAPIFEHKKALYLQGFFVFVCSVAVHPQPLMWANIGIYTGREDNRFWREMKNHQVAMLFERQNE